MQALATYSVNQVCTYKTDIAPLVRITSAALTTQCRQRGLPLDIAEMCGGLLASVVDDLVTASKLPATDFERSKRIERVLAAVQEPYAHALKLAMACSPLNGRACARHWDAICDKPEIGKLAWLLGMDTENARVYGKRIAKLQK